MKYTYAAIAAAYTVACLACAPRAEAGGHGTRIDQENGAGCMSTYTTNATNAGAGDFTPGGTYENATACTANFADNTALGVTGVLFPDGTYNGAAINNGANDPTSPFLATNGTMYQYFTGDATGIPDAQVSVWTLGNANNDTEIELNGWCLGGGGASFTFGGNTFAGGCGGTSPTDLLFDNTGAVIGFVTYTTGDPFSATTESVANLTGWTENGQALGGNPASAPEMDASSVTAALTLLFGAFAVLLAGGRRTLVRLQS